jgi:hypothetical protein
MMALTPRGCEGYLSTPFDPSEVARKPLDASAVRLPT